MTRYAFGDTDLARERLGLVAETFREPTARLLADVPPGVRRYVLDLGCGPGYTTALLLDAFGPGYVTGLDSSSAMLAEARMRVPAAFFVVADVTAPLKLPAHVVFSRMLLGHLPEPERALDRWANAVLPGGALVCEEPVRYRSTRKVFERYEATVTEVVAAQGATLWAGPALDSDPPRCHRAIDRIAEHAVAAGRAAAMFWRNATTWRGAPDLIAELQDLERANPDETVVWEIRQTCWIKR